MTALAIHKKQVYSGPSTAWLRLRLINPDLLIDNPVDLNCAAWMHGRPNCTIYALIEKMLGTGAATSLSHCNNNAVAWFDALSKMGIALKKDFTNPETGVTLLKQPEMKMEVIGQPAVEKNKKEKLDNKKRIKKLTQENPRRAGTAGWKSWEVLKPGMDVAGFLEEGGRLVDLKWDLKKGNLELY